MHRQDSSRGGRTCRTPPAGRGRPGRVCGRSRPRPGRRRRSGPREGRQFRRAGAWVDLPTGARGRTWGAGTEWHLPCPVVSLTMARAEFVLRPFEGLPSEPDWVAMREVVPAATATARTTAEHGSRDIRVVTVLPQAWPALHRSDGVVMLALQQNAGSGDASRDLADLLLRAVSYTHLRAHETVLD